jgi:TetR/AcrR family tetracycline transcriptional repressor
VVGTALRLVEAGGYEELTVRSLASALGVAPMTLYHYVKSKDDLLDEVVDRMLAKAWRPSSSAGRQWRDWVAEAADKFRQFLVDQPAALHVYLEHPVVSPESQRRMQEMLAALRQAGLDESGARRAYAALHTYTIGFAALQASRSGWKPEPGTKPIALQLAAYTTPRQFSEGLAYILEGIERRAARDAAAATKPPSIRGTPPGQCGPAGTSGRDAGT